MKTRFSLLTILTVAVLTAVTQAGIQQPSHVIKPLNLALEADSRPTWNQAVSSFSEQLADAYQLNDQSAQHFSQWILDASQRHFVPSDLMAALINTESNFRTQATSWANAVGPAQVIPRVWGNTCQGDLKDPASNIQCGALVLRHYYVRYCKSLSWLCALEYYHTGPGKMAMGKAYAQTRRSYVDKVGTNLARLADNANHILFPKTTSQG